MADNDVRIKLTLDGADQVQQGLAGVGDGASDADSKLGNLITGGLKGAGVALVGFATAAVAAGGALTAGVIDQYAQYEQNLGGIETMFGAAGQSAEEYAASIGKTVDEAAAEYARLMQSQQTMIDYADQAYMTAGLSANEYMEQVTSFSASLLQGLEGDTVAAAEVANMAMIDMSDNANKFGTNIADIQNAYQGFAKQNYTMLDNLKLGYGGTAAEMARLVNDSGVLGDTMEVTAQTINDVSFDKIIEAIHVVQDEMGVAGTTALEAEATISGSIGMLQASWANLLTGLGSADADVAALTGNVINSFELVVQNVTPVIENIGSGLAELGPQLGGMLEGLVESIATVIPDIINAGVGMIDGLVSGITGALPSLITALVPAAVGLVEMFANQAPALVDAGLQAVVSLGEGIATALPTLLPLGVEMILGVVDSIINNLPSLLDVALQLVMALAQGVLAAVPVLVQALPGLITSLVDFLVGAIPTIIDAGIELLTSLVTALPEIIDAIVTALPLIIDGIVTALLEALPILMEAGIELFMALIEALPEIIIGIAEAIPQIITAVLDAIVNAIPLLIKAGIDLLMGLIGALPQIITGIVAAIPQIMNALLGAVAGSIGSMIKAGYELLIGLVGNLGQAIGFIVGKVPQIITGIVDKIKSGFGRVVSIGGDLVRGLWDGISGAAGWLMGKIRGFVDNVVGNIASFFGISSPSKVLRDEIGKFLPSGIGVGVELHEQDAIKPITRMNRHIMEEVRSLHVAMPTLQSPEPRRMAPVAYMASTPAVALQRPAQDGLGRDLARALGKGVAISSQDMDVMATKVAQALHNIRRADGRDTVMTLKQGAL